jgi:alpha-1,2-glucosyltransferase
MVVHIAVSVLMGLSIKLFTWVQVILGRVPLTFEFTFRIHHPFLLSDNRHYTFYVWRRIFLLHPVVPYLFIPGYIVCAWTWFLRVGAYGCSTTMLIDGIFTPA